VQFLSRPKYNAYGLNLDVDATALTDFLKCFRRLVIAVFVFPTWQRRKMTTELLKPILILIVGYALRLALVALGVELDEAVFNTLVVAIVAYILAALGVEVARFYAPNRFK
jgi:hypothetical protein